MRVLTKNDHMSRSATLLFFIVVINLVSCKSNETGNAKDVNPETIYFDYQVSGDAGNDYVTVKLQYRFAGPNGTTLLLEAPSQVTLDGTVIPADSSKMNGTYYEVMLPAASFNGRHRIVFTGPDEKTYAEEFVFTAFGVRSGLPDTLTRGDWELELDGVQPADRVEVMLTDTAFGSDGITRVDTLREGKLLIRESDLNQLASGPITLLLSRETDRPVKNGTREGGRITTSYMLNHAFELR